MAHNQFTNHHSLTLSDDQFV